jgi:hypothetical protein
MWVDASSFADQVRVAVDSLGRGDPQCPALDGPLCRWATGPREQHMRTALALLDALTDAALDSDDPDAAVGYLERAVDIAIPTTSSPQFVPWRRSRNRDGRGARVPFSVVLGGRQTSSAFRCTPSSPRLTSASTRRTTGRRD